PSGDSSGDAPSATRHAPPPAERTAQIARSGPFGSWFGLATHPSRFGAEPRTKTITLPSSETSTSVRSMPSSRSQLVRRTGAKPGAAAVYTFRMPRSYAIHAIRSAFFADASVSGDAGLRNCATVGWPCAGADAAGRSAASASAAARRVCDMTWLDAGDPDSVTRRPGLGKSRHLAAEQGLRALDPRDECVDVRRVVVHVDARARRRRHIQPTHQRLRAVVPGANADPRLVEHGGEVMRVDPVHGEAYDAAARFQVAGAVRPNAAHGGEAHEDARDELHFVRAHLIHPDAIEIIARGREPHRVSDVGCSRLELVREHVPRGAVVADELDHVAAHLVRRHLLEQRAAS